MLSLIALLLIFIFWPGFTEIFRIYTSPWFFDNALTASAILILFFFLARKQINVKTCPKILPPAFLILSLALILNNCLGNFQIISPILAYLAIYLFLGLILNYGFWQRSFPIFVLLILTLPILERLQKFIGFPLRLLTADLVSILLQLIGVANLSQSTVIITENHATTIDLPCGGVKSIYFGAIFLLASFFLNRVKLSLKSLSIGLIFFVLLFFFNFWRVFSLTYIYGVLKLSGVGDSIHLTLGLIGFILSCLFLWFQSQKLSSPPPATKSPSTISASPKFIILILLSTIILNYLFKSPQPPAVLPQNVSFTLPELTLASIPLTAKEQSLFFTPDVSLAAKYQFVWHNKNVSLLLVKSKSARSHHDPQICLQSLGYKLANEENIMVASHFIKQIEIDPGFAYYWYQSSNDIISDYSQRVWQQFNRPNQDWVLVELLIPKSQQPTSAELSQLFLLISLSVNSQLLN
ncbi:MAG: exosortase O [Candidatus Shapirobacteria bacterium]|jgi:exosortase O